MDVITPTTILTNTHAVALVTLSSGNIAMIDYSISIGDVAVIALLSILVVFQVMQMWRGGWLAR